MRTIDLPLLGLALLILALLVLMIYYDNYDNIARRLDTLIQRFWRHEK